MTARLCRPSSGAKNIPIHVPAGQMVSRSSVMKRDIRVSVGLLC